jgi:hypothetical protein
VELAPEGVVQAEANILGKGKKLAVAIELNRLLGAVEHGVTVIAVGQVGLQGALQVLGELIVQIA